MMDDTRDQIINFCNIQLQIISDREDRLRKEILDCKIQTEFLTSILSDLYSSTSKIYTHKKKADKKVD